jgi:hypothetical protein
MRFCSGENRRGQGNDKHASKRALLLVSLPLHWPLFCCARCWFSCACCCDVVPP